MKLLKATLAFVLGLVLGIILLVLAIGGTVVALGTTRTVGDIQSAVTNEQIISPDSELYGQTVLEAVQKALHDYQNFDDITLKLLYERYGIDLLKGISGLDFTQKSFYDKPLTDIINDLSILLDDIYLSDIEKVAGLDFLQYNIPLINENMNVGLRKALDNMMKLVNDDLTLRTLKNKLNLDLGAEANGILSALQDVKLKSIGGLIDALRLDALLTSDTDTYLFKGVSQVYSDVRGTADEWEEVSEADLKNPDYKAPVGVETFIAGGDEEGNLIEKEMRYYKYEGQDPVADNSCYNDGWTCPEGATVLRHRLYKPFTGNGAADGKYVVQGYANRVETVDTLADHFTLLAKEFVSLDDIYVDENGTKIAKTLVSNGKLDLGNVSIYYALQAEEEGAPLTYEKSGGYSILDEELTKDCLLRVPAEPTVDDEGNPVSPDPDYKEGRDIYLKSHGGTSSPLIQYLTYLTIGYIRNDTDAIIKNVHIGDIIDTDAEGVADVLKALKDSTLDSIGEDINSIPFGKMFGESDNQLLNAIKDFTLATIDQDMDKLTLGDIIDTTEPDTPPILVALKDCHFDELSEKVDTLKLSEVMTINGSSPQILRALAKHDATLSNMNDVIQELSVGELLEVEYDIYTLDSDDGAYVRMYYYTEFNSYVDFEGTYGKDAVRGDYKKDTDVFTPNAEGDWVKTYYYVLYDKNHDDADVARYTLTTPGETALAVQSLARRGVPALEMGKHLNDLSIGELMRIEPDSAQLFKTLSRRSNSNLDNIANAANELTIGEIIEIDEHSSKIMKSLAARNCTLGNMATITDELTLIEILDITNDAYTGDSNGKYVHLTDGPDGGYVPYDLENPDNPEWRTKYVKVLVPGSEEDGNAQYKYEQYDPEKPEHNGLTVYVQAAYYTLYNPAVHNVANLEAKGIEFEKEGDDVKRFKKEEYKPAGPGAPDAPSSKILQRFAGSTMGDFSTAFDEIMLSDVMDIDADIYAAVTSDEIKYEKDKGYYYGSDRFEEGKVIYKYDAENGVYSVANQKEMQQAQEDKLTLYHVSITGESPTILKKLAYVKVDKMADALDAVMKDMVLSEIIDIHVYDAVESMPEDFFDNQDGAEFNNAEYNGSDKRYYIPWDGKTTINGEPVVYVYEATGKYIAKEFYFLPITESNATTYLGTPTTQYFKYVQYQLLSFEGGSQALLKQVESGNVYIKQDDGTYIYNVALATYYASQAISKPSSETQAKISKLYYKEKCNQGDEGAIEYQAYNAIPAEYKDNICVEVLGKKTTKDLSSGGDEVLNLYDPSNPFHSDLPKYVRLEDNNQNYIVPLNVPEYKYQNGIDIRLGTKYAREVMVKQASLDDAQKAAAAYCNGGNPVLTDKGCNNVYVFLPSTNSYEVYDSDNEGHNIEGTQYYTKQIGYVAHFGEVFYETEKDVKCATNLQFKEITVEREHSSKVLTLLANETINDMNSAIEKATINDFMDITPGTIFDEAAIRNSTLNNLGTAIAQALSTMTIGRLLEWGSVTEIDAQVRTILEGITLTKFFGALTYQDGTIVIDMEELYKQD